MDRILGARHDLAGERQHARGAQPLDHFEQRAVDLGDDLDHAVMVAQIDEDEVAVSAPAMYPTRYTDGFPGAGRAKLAAGMGAIGVHDGISDCVTPARAGDRTSVA